VGLCDIIIANGYKKSKKNPSRVSPKDNSTDLYQNVVIWAEKEYSWFAVLGYHWCHIIANLTVFSLVQ